MAMFCLRLLLEVVGRWSENSYLELRAFEAAVSSSLLVYIGVYIARRIVRDGDNVAMWASIAAVFVGTFYGVYDLKSRGVMDERTGDNGPVKHSEAR
tara:strand:- start:3806 stop:4096 length:291 start_codon:yes stop_codon:yes gene_type:complete